MLKESKEIDNALETIRVLRQELKQEQQIVDYYAAKEVYVNTDNYCFGMLGSPIEIDKGRFARNRQLIRKFKELK